MAFLQAQFGILFSPYSKSSFKQIFFYMLMRLQNIYLYRRLIIQTPNGHVLCLLNSCPRCMWSPELSARPPKRYQFTLHPDFLLSFLRSFDGSMTIRLYQSAPFSFSHHLYSLHHQALPSSLLNMHNSVYTALPHSHHCGHGHHCLRLNCSLACSSASPHPLSPSLIPS